MCPQSSGHVQRALCCTRRRRLRKPWWNAATSAASSSQVIGASPTRPAGALAVGDPTGRPALPRGTGTPICAHGARSSPRAGRWPHRAAPHRGAAGPAPVWLSAGSCAHAVATPLTGRGSRHQAGRVVRSSGRVASILRLRGVSREGWYLFLHTLYYSLTTLETGLTWYRQYGQARPQLSHPSPTWSCASESR